METKLLPVWVEKLIDRHIIGFCDTLQRMSIEGPILPTPSTILSQHPGVMLDIRERIRAGAIPRGVSAWLCGSRLPTEPRHGEDPCSDESFDEFSAFHELASIQTTA
jgi:hypothetical protein